jgi:hypothetical protein
VSHRNRIYADGGRQHLKVDVAGWAHGFSFGAIKPPQNLRHDLMALLATVRASMHMLMARVLVAQGGASATITSTRWRIRCRG